MLSFLVVLVAAAFFLPACREEKKVDVASRLNPERMPTMSTENVSTLISDSGITQYKIVSPLWLVYDNADTPYWSFPKGLYLRKYDPLFRVIATVAADSARYFKNMRLWRLDGNVELTKAPKDLFLTQQLFWDERRQEIYSDSFIHIETTTHVLEGHGFISNDKLTGYRIIRPTGIFPGFLPALHVRPHRLRRLWSRWLRSRPSNHHLKRAHRRKAAIESLRVLGFSSGFRLVARLGRFCKMPVKIRTKIQIRF